MLIKVSVDEADGSTRFAFAARIMLGVKTCDASHQIMSDLQIYFCMSVCWELSCKVCKLPLLNRLLGFSLFVK